MTGEHRGNVGTNARDEADERRRRAIWWIFPSVVSLVVIGIGLATLFSGDDGESVEVVQPASNDETNADPPVTIPLAFNGADSTDGDPSFEHADEVGNDPFVSPQDLVDEFEVSFEEETPYGLFGGTLENTCNPSRLADFLEANPDKGEEWARVQGIPIGELRT